MKLVNFAFIIFLFLLANPAQAANQEAGLSIPDIPPPPPIDLIDDLQSSTSVPALVEDKKSENNLAPEIEVIRGMMAENESIQFSKKVFKDYHKQLLSSVETLLDYAPKYRNWSENVFSSLKFQLETEKEINLLRQAFQNENKIKVFFLGFSSERREKLNDRIEKNLEKINDIQFVQERMKDRKDWKALGQEVYDLRFTFNKATEEIEKELDKFSIWGWIISLFS
jgi:hypothetical protein